MTSSVTDQNRYAPTSWGVYDEEMTVPTGQICRVRKLDLPDVMASGMMDQLNTLQGVVDKNVRKSSGQPPATDPMKLLSDRRTAKQMAELMNQVVCLVVTAPIVEMPPEKREDRVDGVIYADTVHMLDKIEIFAKAMGDLEELGSFRGEPVQPA